MLKHLIIWFFLIPTILLGFNQDECALICGQSKRFLEDRDSQINSAKNIPNNTEQQLEYLKQALNLSKMALGNYERILTDISGKPKSEQSKRWCSEMKTHCETKKRILNEEISDIEKLISHVKGIIAYKLYQTSIEMGALAESKSLVLRGLTNIDEVVSSLKEAAKHYQEAATFASEAYNLVIDENSKAILKNLKELNEDKSELSRKEANEWPVSVCSQIKVLKDRILDIQQEAGTLLEDERIWEYCELQKKAVPILERLVSYGLHDPEELNQLKKTLSHYEGVAVPPQSIPKQPLSDEEFKIRECKRKSIFFNNDNLFTSLKALLQSDIKLSAIPLDGQLGRKANSYSLFSDQFYRFLIQSDKSVTNIIVRIFSEGEQVHEERIDLPIMNALMLDRYLTTDGMLYIPETKLKEEFGMDFRLNYVFDASGTSFILAQKGIQPGLQVSVSLDNGRKLYECDFIEAPPWQLGVLVKPAQEIAQRRTARTNPSVVTIEENFSWNSQGNIDLVQYSILDQLVEELNSDPLLLAEYVHNEIQFEDLFLTNENGVFQAPSIHRNPGITCLDGKGSQWELCHLLVYLLRKAGYEARYVMSETLSLPKPFAEKLLAVKIPDENDEVLVRYPWVMFSNNGEWISLFPWMKEMQVVEGFDLYDYMPDAYASAGRWILSYLTGDEMILKHIGPDEDDSATVIFTRFVEEELNNQGLSISEIGFQRSLLKRSITSWADFPRPKTNGKSFAFDYLGEVPNIFAYVNFSISPHEIPGKSLFSNAIRLADLDCYGIPIRFGADENDNQFLIQFSKKENSYWTLPIYDRLIDINVGYIPNDSQNSWTSKVLTIPKGTIASLCFHLGGTSSKKTSQFFQVFTNESDEKRKVHSLLDFVGASYFEKCSRSEGLLASMNKVKPKIVFACGLSKLTPGSSKSDSMMPQVDMHWFFSNNEYSNGDNADVQFTELFLVDSSSNEHQVICDIFKDQYAISTVKLLQLAHQTHKKNGLDGIGFLFFGPGSFEAANEIPEIAQLLYFPQFKELNLRKLQKVSSGQWNVIENVLKSKDYLRSNSCAIMTPALIPSQNEAYKELGSLIFSLHEAYALISNNNLISNGGLGSPLPQRFLTSSAIREWELVPTNNTYTLQIPSLFETVLTNKSSPGTTEWSSDVRLDHKSPWDSVADPVDVVTGAFYIDEIDLLLQGPFPIAIRRNYNSQNPLVGDFGCGWKLSLNPFLIEQDGKLYAAEVDGTVIVYSYNDASSRWEPTPEENPDLWNYSHNGSPNPYHAFIKNNVLYSPDGSIRFFEGGLLKKWVNANGDYLSFSYKERQLSRIESSNGNFCGFHYNYEKKISEIYSMDGRRYLYDYDSQGDLVRVTFPNNGVVSYDYDRDHRIIRETKPHGKILENTYLDGKVVEQRSPMGQQQKLIPTAKFNYSDGVTVVTDARGGKTIYKIFRKQIYKITDPIGYDTVQSWFINENTWFDAETESVREWNVPGGGLRSLKSTKDKRGLTTYYLYDDRGNPEEMTLFGNDLTGNGEKSISKKLIYNDRNLLEKESVCGQKTVYIYDPVFSYLLKRVEKSTGEYTEWTYNALGQIEKEDRSGSVTLWKYDARGYPLERVQVTGTEDPDVITTYSYNNQGNCIEVNSQDGVQKYDFDIMGNLYLSEVYSYNGTLLSATYIGYDFNNNPIWKQTATPGNIVYFDYNSFGLVKSVRQSLSPTPSIAYTLYDYDPCGNLIEETDPRGYGTSREYDLLGKVICETKEKLSIIYTYEPGGQLKTIKTPSEAITTRVYTTNGLLKEEIYPDGTKNTFQYDFFGRPVLETKNDLSWEIVYDDDHHKVTRTQLRTKQSEVSEFDLRGNLIRFTDLADYTHEKSYDGLNRIKTESSPSGEDTFWNYQGDCLICINPQGEKSVIRHEGENVAETQVFDPQGALISTASYHYDPEKDIEVTLQGDVVTTTWMNALGLPIKVQTGNTETSYQYDRSGNCIELTDGDGRKEIRTYDGLSRLTQKLLPDGTLLKYVYDRDSNLEEFHLPNGMIQKCFHDSMGRKRLEELQSMGQTTQRWEFIYKDGYLKEVTDPMKRLHTYNYDDSGRLARETVGGWQRIYTYDPRGMLSTAEQMEPKKASSWFSASSQDSSKVERFFDQDGRLYLESIYLNSNLIQRSKQTWRDSIRSLEIGAHKREFTYRNNRLVKVSVPNMDVSYAYELNGSLKSQNTPFGSTTIGYNDSGLPELVSHKLPGRSFEESLGWYPSGRLLSHSSPLQAKKFAYSTRGNLQTAGSEEYGFDFGLTGSGLRTTAPGWHIPKDGLDPFGRVRAEVDLTRKITMDYDLMGQLIVHDQRKLEWDPWGRLLKVEDHDYSWEASYDALGRRLQTRYIPNWGSKTVKTSFYDPEVEFQEIGVKVGEETFWKIYGPDSCDAVIDEKGLSLGLIHDALGNLIAIATSKEITKIEKLPGSYGPLSQDSLSAFDLNSFAKSLVWQSKSLDPTGYIWFGARYYDPRSGRFLSTDPVGYPLFTDLYAYANGDPINYRDTDGRFSNSAYLPIPSISMGFNLLKEGANSLAAYLANHEYTNSKCLTTSGYELKNGAIGFINGIDNSMIDHMFSLEKLSGYAKGAKIYGIYNATNSSFNWPTSIGVDILESATNHLGVHSTPVQLLKNQWARFIATYPPEAKFLQVSHSGGAGHVFNALSTSPEHVRQRIISLAFAPSVIIPKKMCYQSFNYISKRDFVTNLDFIGNWKYGNQLTVLEPHAEAPFWDHKFLSRTFENIMNKRIGNFIFKYGGLN